MTTSEAIDKMIDIETEILQSCELYRAYYAEICNAQRNGISIDIVLPPQTMEQITDQMAAIDEKCNTIASCIDTAMVTDELCAKFLKSGMDAEYQNGEQTIMSTATEVDLLCSQIQNIMRDIEPHIQLAISRIREITQ